MDPGRYVWKAIRVFCIDDDEWYSGAVDNYHPDKGWHIQYYDGEEEWLTTLDKNVAFDDPVDEDEELLNPDSTSSALGDTNMTEFSVLEIAIDNRTHIDMPGSSETVKNVDTCTAGSNATDKSRPPSDDYNSYRSAIKEKPATPQRDYTRESAGQNYSPEEKSSAVAPRDREKDSYRRRDYKEESLHIIENVPENVPTSAHDPSNTDSRPFNRNSTLDVPSKGLLLVGKVFGASNLPAPDRNESDGKCFFRVLYVEGTGQSSMFRCKTSIFSSNVTDDLQFPQWGETGNFNFEMIMPDSNRQNGELQLQGQILVAVYRVRGQGGYEFLGQACFELTEFIQNGVKDSHQLGVEMRSLSGEYPLIDRFDKSIGNYAEIQVNLQIAWRPDSFLPDERNAQSARGVPSQGDKGVYGARGGSSVGGHSVRGGGGGGGGGSVAGVRGGGSVGGTVRTGVSRVASRPSSAAPANRAISRAPPPVKMVSAQLRKQANDKRRIDAENKMFQSRLQAKGTRGRGDVIGNIYKTQPAEAKQANTSVSRKCAKDTDTSLESVLDSWTKLKKEVAEIEDENLLLKATLSKLKTHTKRHELTTDRLKKQAKPTASESKCDVSVSRDESAMRGFDRDEEEDSSDIVDNELREIALEHSNLQQLRRGLVERAKVANMTCDDHVAVASTAQDAEAVLRSRIGLVAPFAVSPQGMQGGPQRETSSEQINLQSMLERLRNVQLDFLCAEAAQEHGFHFGALMDAIEEDRELLILLRKKNETFEAETEKCRRDRDDAKDRLNKLIEEKTVYKIRDNINDLRLDLFKLRKKKCLEALEAGSDYLEREIIRSNLKS